MGPGPPVHDLAGGKDRTEWNSSAQSFCQADDVGFEIEVFDGQELAGSVIAGLDFIIHVKDPMPVADFSQALKELFGWDNVASFSLDGFNEHGRDFIWGDFPLEDHVFNVVQMGFGTVRAVLMFGVVQEAVRRIAVGSMNHWIEGSEVSPMNYLGRGEAEGP